MTAPPPPPPMPSTPSATPDQRAEDATRAATLAPGEMLRRPDGTVIGVCAICHAPVHRDEPTGVAPVGIVHAICYATHAEERNRAIDAAMAAKQAEIAARVAASRVP